jgi:hypothetical protein
MDSACHHALQSSSNQPAQSAVCHLHKTGADMHLSSSFWESRRDTVLDRHDDGAPCVLWARCHICLGVVALPSVHVGIMCSNDALPAVDGGVRSSKAAAVPLQDVGDAVGCSHGPVTSVVVGSVAAGESAGMRIVGIVFGTS